MESALQWILGALVILSSVLSVFFSYRSRRTANAVLRGLYGARMNICLGSTLILLALIQMLLFSGSTLRVIVGAVFLVLGLFNLFAGMRNHSHFTKHRSSAQ
ncbi:YtpI family protein [Cohnella thailandensis]|jgi:hypothetical protein|uniref:YtpI family protein n=1 Tax=Cohnella thailandensis TaxID=557557 RepID=A0A841SZ58_9BACL|nr:YtpI family protein [Cohnella thailandensis]MBB6635916.1 YtpI family protein [Cohnella thailandensis]MBP1976294.1 uncharacterized membrane protein HdeD (DUF308 family) [Cohnella thailandensis]